VIDPICVAFIYKIIYYSGLVQSILKSFMAPSLMCLVVIVAMGRFLVCLFGSESHVKTKLSID
jgi:hydrogenase-4 membrane subunit HyfE